MSGVLGVDPVARTAEVQGMTTYEDLVDATLAHGLMPLVVPQLKTITLGGAVTGLGIESTSFRHGLPHESVRELDVLTGAGELVTATPDGAARRPLPRFPQLLRHARLRPAPGHRPAAGCAVRPAAAPPLSRRSQLHRGRRRARRSRRPARLPRRHRLRRRGAVPHHGHVRPRNSPPGLPRATTPDSGSSTAPSSSAASTTSPSATISGAGTPTGSGALEPWVCSIPWCAACGRVASAAPTSTAASSPSTGGTGSATGSTGCAAGPWRSWSCRTSRSRCEHLPEFLEAFHRDVGIAPVWLCPVAPAIE